MNDASPEIMSLFHGALERSSAEERAAYLDAACGQNAELREQLEALLQAHEQAGGFLPARCEAPGQRAADARSTTEQSGVELAGRYRLLQQIGEGGMGTVWMAQQTDPVKRLVAVKLVKPDMDSRAVLARFEAERQALALMDHPHIARVLDAGAAPDGRPFFVMELVQGIPITSYCDLRQLTPRQRLELFVPVCQAVQHAHQKGVIHRDLKPSNVLVALYDGKPMPKVIDFGIAKATGSQLTEQSLHTGFGTVVGTVEYMSPEQATLNQLDVDTRSDVYALGVLLYELLAGTPPFGRQELVKPDLLEMLRVIREQEPTRPSDRLTTAKSLPTLAANRGTDPGRLTAQVRGELDWIVMKALEKDRSRRYDSANSFALDVQRYLHDEPVSAGPPSVWYRLRKFIRRNKRPVLAAGLVLGVLVAGMVGTTLGLVRALTAERQAIQERDAREQARKEAVAAGEAERLAKELAQKRLGQVDKASEILGSIFEGLDPKAEAKGGPGLRVQLAQQLEKATQQLDGEAVADVLTVARLQHVLGRSQGRLGNLEQARVLLEKALATRQVELGSDHPDTLSSMHHLATLYLAQGKYDRAEPLFLELLQVRTVKLGADHLNTLTTKNNLASVYHARDRYDQAEPFYREVLEAFTASLGADHADTLAARNNLATLYMHQGKYDRAEPLYRETLQAQTTTLGANHPHTLMSKSNLASLYRNRRQFDRAEQLFHEALQAQTATLGADHPDTLTSKYNLARLYREQAKYDRAERLFLESLQAETARLGADHPATLTSKQALGKLYYEQAKYDQAERLNLEVLQAQTARLGADCPESLMTRNNLALMYKAQGKYDRAEPLYLEVLQAATATLGREHPVTLSARSNLASLYLSQRKNDRAERLYLEALQVSTASLSADHPSTLIVKNNLAAAYKAQGKYQLAEPLYRDVLRVETTQRGADHPSTLVVKNNLATLYQAQGKYQLAQPLFTEAVEGARRKLGLAHPDTQGYLRNLGDCFEEMKQPARAEPLWRELAVLVKEKAGADSPAYAAQLAVLGGNLLLQARFAEARATLRECLVIRQQKEPDAWTTFNTRSMLGSALVGQKQYAEAEPLLVQGYEGLKQRKAELPDQVRAVRLSEALERLVQLYDAWDRKDQAARWRKELEACRKDSEVGKQGSKED